MWFNVDKPGIYRGACAELCGKDHAFMPVVVNALPEAEYEAWLESRIEMASAEAAGAEREWTMPELMETGEKVYGTYCAACHQPQGQGLPPAFPTLAGAGLSVNPDGLQDHINIVLYGSQGTAMQAYGPTLSASELAGVITYERNAWGNDTGDMVQPSQISELLGSQ